MDDVDDWERLIEALDVWTSAAQIAPGRIRVSVGDGEDRRDVVIVMTPDEWDDMAGVMWGDIDAAVNDVKRSLASLQPSEEFAVYSQYRLEPSDVPVLPVPPDHPPFEGEWVTLDREGRITSRFAEWIDPDERG